MLRPYSALTLYANSFRCVPSQSGLFFEDPQPQSVTRLRVSKGWPSERSIGILPVTQTAGDGYF